MLLVAGCGKKTGTVTGTVKYKGTALTTGTITFFGPDKKQQTGSIDATGNFSVSDVPVGKCKVTIIVADTSKTPGTGRMGGMDPSKMGAGDKAKEKDAAKPPVLIPKEYGSLETTKLSVDVESGSNSWNKDLD